MTFPPLYSYAWAAGSGVALVSLRNVETDIGARNRRSATDAIRRVAIQSQPVNAFPLRTPMDDGSERGDGLIQHQWTMVLCKFGVKYVLDTYLSSGAAVSAAMTIYTRRHELDSYVRYNAYLILPNPGQDIEYIRHGVFRVTWRFTNLVAL